VRNEVVVATKFGFEIVDGKIQPGALNSEPAHIREVAEASLARLQIECIETCSISTAPIRACRSKM
jgi:aryl-alcohol dehydrogenase-like predicted oxidoreductase